MQYYKIRNMATDKYSSGGQTPHWSKKGYSWSSEETVKDHVRGFFGHDFYKNCVIECLEMQEVALDMTLVSDFFDLVSKQNDAEKKEHQNDMAVYSDFLKRAVERRLKQQSTGNE